MKSHIQTARKGFTLIELLVVSDISGDFIPGLCPCSRERPSHKLPEQHEANGLGFHDVCAGL